MTETSPVTHMIPRDPARARDGSVGPVVQNTECKLDDGEICVRGPQVMKGYLNNPEATAAMIDRDGWLHTGDIGHADQDGYFYVVDRVKELIKYKGMQVAPAELEAVLVAHPLIADAAVIGIPDAEAGELPKAFVVKRGELDAESVMAFVAERVAPHKKIRSVEFVDAIPKSPSGKILRRLLRSR
jgi:acyl-CoA synthetase (AMP-forming)/AMP-acid ligase II